MDYKVKEIFDSIQGEGIDTGKLCTFIRLSGCNLFCDFCDEADTQQYRTMDEHAIYGEVLHKNIVITGGEPLIQDLNPLIRQLKGYSITIETNGTTPLNVFHFACNISLSPKVPRDICKVYHATSLKIVYPFLRGVTPREFFDFPAQYKSIHILNPIMCPNRIPEVMEILSDLPTEWHMGIQLHKYLGVK